MPDLIARVAEAFRGKFNEAPLLFRSPGRVNLIGEHTDYNGGFVLPAAADKAVIFAIAPRDDRQCHFVALDMGETYQGDFTALAPSAQGWPNYLLGVAAQFSRAGVALRGVNAVFAGDVPIGGGMSSSAALEGGFAYALNQLFALQRTPLQLVKIAQAAEHEFVGVQCGIMDQYINIFGKAGTVIKLDCRSLEHEYVPFANEELRIVVCDSRVRRQLATSEYNVRRAQCEAGVAKLRAQRPGIESLRDVTAGILDRYLTELTPVEGKRCRYVIEENERLQQACDALQKNDFARFGRCMVGSHAGLRDLYEVSCAELDFLAEQANALPGVLGSRMMGAGFGGCTISLIEKPYVESFSDRISELYHNRFSQKPQVHVIQIAGGTAQIAI